MITQYIEELPEGKSTPDFTRKPIALTIQEGKHIKTEEWNTSMSEGTCHHVRQMNVNLVRAVNKPWAHTED